MSGKEICKAITKDGWVFVRSCGDHRTFKKEGVRLLVTVPMHHEVSIGVVKSIEKITGLSLRRKW